MDTAKARAIVAELKVRLQELYGTRLRGVYLYGSYARNEQDDESDLDILIVLDAIPHYRGEINRTSIVIGGMSARYGLTLSRVFVSERDWARAENSFVRAAKQESLAA